MGKGHLKERLQIAKVKEDYEKKQLKKQQKEKESLRESGPKTVTKEEVEAKEAAKQAVAKAKAEKKAAAKAAKEEKALEYESKTLSKKQQRQLKKAIEAKLEEEEKEVSEDDEEEDEEEKDVEIAEDTDSEMEEYLLDLEKLARSDDDDEDEDEEEQDEDAEEQEEEDQDEEQEDEEEEEEEDIALSDVEIDSDADVVPHTKLTVNNVAALKNALERIELPWSKHSFQEHQSLTTAQKVESQIKDIYDDTERELAFYKQALEATTEGRAKLLKLKVLFTRPQDYFAEMVKSDEHMDKLKNKLIKEASEKKASQEARRQRDLKKFGKQVQNATLQERQKQKRETLEKIKGLKRKRQNDEIKGDEFDIAIEEATADTNEREDRFKRNKPSAKREAKNKKYGFGGIKRFKRKNDASSSADMTDFSVRKMKGKSSKRPGKSRRH
jgi:rRNA-processing protein EBP2